MSLSEDREGRLAALGAGADDLICKPVDEEDTKFRLNALLRRARLQSGTNGNRSSQPLQTDPEAQPSGSTTKLYHQLVDKVNQAFQKTRENKCVDLAPIGDGARALVKEMDGGNAIVAMAPEKTEVEDLAAHHTNVDIISVTLDKELGLPPDLMQRLALLAPRSVLRLAGAAPENRICSENSRI
jgi:hypothetical protein